MLIEDNTKSIENLVGVISFIEASQTEAGKRAAELKAQVDQLDTSTVEYQTKSQELARMAEVVITLEQQHTEYVSCLYAARSNNTSDAQSCEGVIWYAPKIGHASSQYDSNNEASIAQLVFCNNQWNPVSWQMPLSMPIMLLRC